MALPRIVVCGRKLILLNGFKDAPKTPATFSQPVIIAQDKFQKAVKRNPDAVAFGYVAGEWVAAA